jgi:hypothetical protein
LNDAKEKTKDTIVVEKKIEKIVRDTVRIPVFPKPSFRPKVDTLSK